MMKYPLPHRRIAGICLLLLSLSTAAWSADTPWPALLAQLRNADALQRVAAVQAIAHQLSEQNFSRVNDALNGALRDRDARVRLAALSALADQGYPPCVAKSCGRDSSIRVAQQ